MSFSSLIVGALTVSTLHAILPSHSLTFVLVASAQGWSKIIRLVSLAGSGHLLIGTMFGLATAFRLARFFTNGLNADETEARGVETVIDHASFSIRNKLIKKITLDKRIIYYVPCDEGDQDE